VPLNLAPNVMSRRSNCSGMMGMPALDVIERRQRVQTLARIVTKTVTDTTHRQACALRLHDGGVVSAFTTATEIRV
jgi:hypothetical protein